MNQQFAFAAADTYSAPAAETPAERLRLRGPASLSDSELIALFIGRTSTGTAQAVAEDVMTYAGSVPALTKLNEQDFSGFPGLGPGASVKLAAVIELARRMMSAQCPHRLDTPAAIAQFMRPRCIGLEVEKFWVISVTRKNTVIRVTEVSSGTQGSTLVHPREVFRQAIKDAASAVVCVHNHPSGDPAPSAADIRVTRTLREAAKTIDIELLDHVIVGSIPTDPTGEGFYSFRDAGVI